VPSQGVLNQNDRDKTVNHLIKDYDSQKMAKQKTRDLILDIALFLFNERGERLVTSVDLANEMNISPGNLYYHFKGKEEIVEELYSLFHAKLLLVVENISDSEGVDTQGLLSYLSLVSTIFIQYRFISQGLLGLCAHYPNLEPQVEKILRRLHTHILTLVLQLPSTAVMNDISNSAKLLTDNLLNTLLHSNVFDVISIAGKTGSEPAKSVIKDRLQLQLLPFISPN